MAGARLRVSRSGAGSTVRHEPAARREQQGLDRGVAVLAEVAGELVDVERDVPLLHVGVHLGGVLGDVAADAAGSFQACSTEARIASVRAGQVERAPGQDRAERDRQPGVGLPPVAEVDQRRQPVRAVGEPRLVDDQAGVDQAVAHRRHDLGERHDRRSVDRRPGRRPRAGTAGRRWSARRARRRWRRAGRCGRRSGRAVRSRARAPRRWAAARSPRAATAGRRTRP